MPLSIRNKKAELLARQAAEETGTSITQVIIDSLEEKLERMRGRRTADSVFEKVMAISKRCSSLPDLDLSSPDEILGYDDSGVNT